ncbi:MAG: bifunctional DNA-formamidopyrimidine glycosylase/DNA-(apurinic or apyrimidinic site) lyase [Gammaproteobacteria bacterium]|nr:MAG: bifunctional DNA-formamidopyrimidine glycosylase/DNA-(apurinic or apyrimidinic site) lyase [Gammaproteobacteria bacterium]
MPELPEVETTCRGIGPHILGQRIQRVIIRNYRLRWPISRTLATTLKKQTVISVSRRAKYILIRFDQGCLILHLGMSGSLRILSAETAVQKHDHVDLVFENGICLRFRDPRRFGSIHWTRQDPANHKLLRPLGPEPLDGQLAGHLYTLSRGRRVAIKQFIMNSHVVVGIGNIYASEALFRAGIHPGRKAGRISKASYRNLSTAIKGVIKQAIQAGGTTLRDFSSSDGTPGYFGQSLNVYGKKGEPCSVCATPITQLILGQRSSYYCKQCQH